MRLTGLLIILTLSIGAMAGGGNSQLTLGEQASHTEVKMVDVSGEKVSVADAAGENGVVVMFSCNTCPFVIKWEDRYSEIKAHAKKNNVGMIVLNSNHTKRSGDDSYEAMKKHASEKKYDFYYVLDENSVLANAYGGQTTPHVFLFNGDMQLVYKGAIDDSYKSADQVKKAYLKDAISSLGNGSTIQVAETKPVGCSIKRK